MKLTYTYRGRTMSEELIKGLGQDVLKEAERLKSLNREEFQKAIQNIKDNKRLGDL
ncbi:MAG: hypothetical protein O6940_12595 [Ignavibacteria bacterium]|nr:hypothetical protein [Ignavibacteria bacterium]